MPKGQDFKPVARNRAACETSHDSAPARDPCSIARRLGAETLETYDEFAALIRAGR